MNISRRKTPFSSHCTLKEGNTDLPFSVLALTQHGVWHSADNINNQDAIGVVLDKSCIINVVCDGCTGTTSGTKRMHSNNEVGAKLINYLSLVTIKKIYKEHQALDAQFINKFTYDLITAINSVAKIFSESEAEKNTFVIDFLTTTILISIVNETNYIVFHAGDGIIAVNGKIESLEDEAGCYLSSAIIAKDTPQQAWKRFKVYKTGETKDLNSLFLATDGFSNFIKNNNELISHFITQSSNNSSNGFENSLIRSFRKDVIWKGKDEVDLDEWFKDDSSFILLKRVDDNILELPDEES